MADARFYPAGAYWRHAWRSFGACLVHGRRTQVCWLGACSLRLSDAHAFSAYEIYVWGVLVASPLLLRTCLYFAHAHSMSLLSAMHAGVRSFRTLVRIVCMMKHACTDWCRLAVNVLRMFNTMFGS